ncbi:MAG: hypothetical protein AAFQ08_02935 [Bacteroidota bacterium]
MTYHSVPMFSEREWAAMTQITNHLLEVSLHLLPLFWLMRFVSDYTQGFLGEELTLKTLFKSLYSGMGLLLVLSAYPQLMEILEHLVGAIIDHINEKARVDRMLENYYVFLGAPLGRLCIPFWSNIPSLLTIIKRFIFEFGIPFMRYYLIYLRGYMLIFSTQVGPLAIALSILPGRSAAALQTWFGMHCSLLCWGITMAILDASLAIMTGQCTYWLSEFIRDYIGAVTYETMYLLLAPLTSFYLGHAASDSLFHNSSSLFRGELLRATPKFLLRIGRMLGT